MSYIIYYILINKYISNKQLKNKIIYNLLYNYILLNENIAYYIINKVIYCLSSILKIFNI